MLINYWTSKIKKIQLKLLAMIHKIELRAFRNPGTILDLSIGTARTHILTDWGGSPLRNEHESILLNILVQHLVFSIRHSMNIC